MKQVLCYFFFFVGYYIPSYSQSNYCATDLKHAALMLTDPEYKAHFIQNQQNIYKYSTAYYAIPNNLKRAKANYTLPVVVHLIVPPGTAIGQLNNLTDVQVEAGLDLLNQSFANQGPFRSTTGVDVGIQFCLAKRDPNGKPTNGITRTESILVAEPTCFPGTNQNSDAAIKQLVNWDCKQYINIWLVTNLFNGNFGCSLAGFAYFPGAPCSVDGIMQEAAFWTSVGGTTVTSHEMGHFFSLNHTFNGGCSNANCLLDGDQVCDTPPDNSASFAPCNTNSCSTDIPDLQDDNTNYMDYSSCSPVHFTAGQQVRMVAALETSRKSLISSKGCIPLGNWDIAAIQISSTGYLCGDSLCLTLKIKNEGLNTINSAVINYQIDGGSIQSLNWLGNLSPNKTFDVIIPCIPVQNGNHNVQISIGNPNGNQDFYLSNNMLTATFQTFTKLELEKVSSTGSHCISDGTILVNTKGGTLPYSYNISNHAFSQTDPFFQLLVYGQYGITVTDANGCQDTVSVIVEDSCFSTAPKKFISNGDALYQGNGCYRLTEAKTDQVGSVWYEDKTNLNQSFDIYFDINLGCIDKGGADGIAFLFQPISTSIGVRGGGLGYQGVTPSLAVEFDTWQNPNYNDPGFDHVAIIKNGNVNHLSADNLAGPLGIFPNFGNAEDCKFHNVLIRWNAPSRTLNVYVDCNLRLSYTGDIVKNIFNNDPNVYFGFTSATGGSVNVHQVCFNYVTSVNQLKDQAICKGEAIQIAVPSEFSKYNWSPNYGINRTDVFNPIFSPDTTTIYFVELIDNCGFKYLDTMTVFVKELVLDYSLSYLDSCSSSSIIILHIKSDSTTIGNEYSIDGRQYSTNTFYEFEAGSSITLYTKYGNCILPTELVLEPNQHILSDSLLWLSSLNCKDSGRVVITGLNGIPPYQYKLDNGLFQSSGIFDGLLPGNYTITTRDVTGCESVRNVEIFDFVKTISLVQDSADLEITCCSPNTFVSVTASGSIPFYYYKIDQGSLQASGEFSNLTPGIHKLTSQDEFGCVSAELSIEVFDRTEVKSDTTFIEICEGDFIDVGTNRYTNTGIYKDVFSNLYCCDSIHFTQLKVNPRYNIANPVILCPRDSIIVGLNVYNKPGIYVDTLQSHSQCDSIIITDIQQSDSYYFAIDTSICEGDPLFFNGQIINQSIIYEDTLQTKFGCDSIINLKVNVFKKDTLLNDQKICDGNFIEVGSSRYTKSGRYLDLISNRHLCDSLIITQLEVYPIYEKRYSYSICEGSFIQVGNHIFDKAGIFKDTLKSISNCDSIISNSVAILPRSHVDLDIDLCYGESFEINGHSYIDEGTYMDTLTNVNQCDSIVMTRIGVHDSALISYDFTICPGESIQVGLANYSSTGVFQQKFSSIWGCDSILVTHVLVESDAYCDSLNCGTYIPNVFSPNRDQINDLFKSYTDVAQITDLFIYSRWGNLIYSDHRPDPSWDGTSHGKDVNPGVFYYVFKGVCKNGKPLSKSGDVTLIR